MKKQSPILIRQKLTGKLVKLLETDSRVLLVLAFGSTANGQENELSDTDLCIVLKDDESLKSFLGETNTVFGTVGALTGYYNYSPYHFYVVYNGAIPLDLYIISASLYFILKSGKSKLLVDNRTTGHTDQLDTAEKLAPMVRDLLLRAYIRNFRLLSKVAKNDLVTLVYIMNSIRDEQLLPLLRIVYGLEIPHAKAVKLQAFPEKIRGLFIDSYPRPSRADCLQAVKSVSLMVMEIAEQASLTMSLSTLLQEIKETHKIIANFK